MPDRKADGWLDNVTLRGSDEPVKVVLEERRGNTLLLRQVDPGEPTPSRIPMFRGDQLVVMTAVSHIGVHSTGEVGAIADLIHSMRVVPVRREGSTVYGRSLRLGEADNGQRIHIRPGEHIAFEAGAIVAGLDAIDAREDATQSGYVPLAGVLSAWFHIGSSGWPAELVRYALAAARRLDMANELLIEVQSLEDEVNADPRMSGPQLRRRLFNVLGSVELAVISLGRGVSMILALPEKFGVEYDLPESLLAAQPALTAIRNAYEHIEDRALGTVHGTPSADALTIFDYDRLLSENLITYGTHTLDLAKEVPGLLVEARATLKGMVSTAVPSSVTVAE